MERTKLSRKVDRLKNTSFRLAQERERLPVPLFWSLFHSEIDSIREEKGRERVLKQVIHGIGE